MTGFRQVMKTADSLTHQSSAAILRTSDLWGLRLFKGGWARRLVPYRAPTTDAR